MNFILNKAWTLRINMKPESTPRALLNINKNIYVSKMTRSSIKIILKSPPTLPLFPSLILMKNSRNFSRKDSSKTRKSQISLCKATPELSTLLSRKLLEFLCVKKAKNSEIFKDSRNFQIKIETTLIK